MRQKSPLATPVPAHQVCGTQPDQETSQDKRNPIVRGGQKSERFESADTECAGCVERGRGNDVSQVAEYDRTHRRMMLEQGGQSKVSKNVPRLRKAWKAAMIERQVIDNSQGN